MENGKHKKTLSTIIRNIIELFGTEIMKDDDRFWSVFLDLSPQMDQERKMIRRICDEHILSSFFRITLASEKEQLAIIASLRLELITNHGFSDMWANELVNAFCEGLGIEGDYLLQIQKVQSSKMLVEEEIINVFYPDRKEEAVNFYCEKTKLGSEKVREVIDEFWDSEADSPGIIEVVLEAEYIINTFYPDKKEEAINYYCKKKGWGTRPTKEYLDIIWNMSLN